MKPSTIILQLKGKDGYVYPEMSLKKFIHILLKDIPNEIDRAIQSEFKNDVLEINLPQIEKYRMLNSKHVVDLGRRLVQINKLKGELKNLK